MDTSRSSEDNSRLPGDTSLREKVMVYLLDGSIVGGVVLQRTSAAIRLSDAFDILEQQVSGGFGPYYFRGARRGNVEIPLTSVKMTRIMPVVV